MTKTERYDGLDALKAICAFMVVCIHVELLDFAKLNFLPLCRVAVPVFFMISGFFYTNVEQKNKEIQQMKKILKMILWGNLLYFICKVVFLLNNYQELTEYLYSLFSFNTLIECFVFNKSPFRVHLWYLGALLYVLIISFVFKKYYSKYKKMMLPLFIGGLLLGIILPTLFDMQIPDMYIRNFIMIGLPYFLLGRLLYERREVLVKIKETYLIISVVLLGVANILERYLWGVNLEIYISTMFFALSLFCLFIKIGDRKFLGKNILCLIGKKYSSMIYIFHILIMNILDMVVLRLNVLYLCNYVAPILVYFLTIFSIFCFNKLIGIVRRK